MVSIKSSIRQGRSAFTVMVVAQLVHVFNCRSERLSLFQLGVGTNRVLVWAFLLSLVMQVAVLTVPAAAPMFKVAPLPIEDWALMGAMGILPFLSDGTHQSTATTMNVLAINSGSSSLKFKVVDFRRISDDGCQTIEGEQPLRGIRGTNWACGEAATPSGWENCRPDYRHCLDSC